MKQVRDCLLAEMQCSEGEGALRRLSLLRSAGWPYHRSTYPQPLPQHLPKRSGPCGIPGGVCASG